PCFGVSRIHLNGCKRGVGYFPQLYRSACTLQPLPQRVFLFRRSLGRLALWSRLLLQHVLSSTYFLLGQVVAGIDFCRFGKQFQRFLQFSLLAQLLSAANFGSGSQEAGALKGDTILQVVGALIVGLFVKLVGGFVILTCLCLDSLVQKRSGRFGSG